MVTAHFVKINGHWHKIAELTFWGCHDTGFSVPTSNNPSKNLKTPVVGLFITIFSACLRRISYEHFTPLLGNSFWTASTKKRVPVWEASTSAGPLTAGMSDSPFGSLGWALGHWPHSCTQHCTAMAWLLSSPLLFTKGDSHSSFEVCTSTQHAFELFWGVVSMLA